MRAEQTRGARAHHTRRLAARDRSPDGGRQHGTAGSDRDPTLATRYWLANTWVEVLPDGACFIRPYEGGMLDTGTLAEATEEALGELAFRIDRGVPLVHTSAWTDPDREIPTLDVRNPIRDALHRFPRTSERGEAERPAPPVHRTPATPESSEMEEGPDGD